MTVRENLELGAYLRRDSRDREGPRAVFELFPRLDERQSQKAGTMSGGEQQMLAIGRALMGNPQILLLDEPSMGISPILTERIYETIAEINQQGMTILLVEQNANFALEVSSAPTCWRPARWPCPTTPPRCGPTPKSRRRTSEHDRRNRTLAHVRVAARRDRRLLPVRPQGLQREGRASRPACCCTSSA
jgi:ABC-type polar amino acid transport system ATPase subunit